MKKKKIVIAGFPNVKNLGDPVLFECTKNIVEKIVNDESIYVDKLDLFYYKNISLINKVIIKLINILNKYLFIFGIKNQRIHYLLEKKAIKIAVESYYNKKLKDSSCVIFAGGGLIKYKYETCDYRLSILIDLAKKYNIPVALNAVGVEGYSEENLRCQEMKKSLNSDIVKSITVRDDIDLLNERYITNKNIKTEKVADSAFWSDVVYNLNKDNNSDVVGLGVVRSKIFKDNDINLNEDYLINFWIDTINELDKNNIKWKVFTNGLETDNDFVDLLFERMKITDKKSELVCIPKSSYELVKIVSKFKKIIACRMHANIIGYSLGIPTIGLVWNQKLKMFGEVINHADRFIEPNNFEANKIIDKLMEIEITEADIKLKNEYRNTTMESLKDFLNKIKF